MSYQVSWGRDVGSATISTIDELNAVLDTIGPVEEDIAYSVAITALDVAHTATIPPLLEIGIGHPQRSFVYHVGADGTSAWGYQPDLPATPDVYADYGGVVSELWPERARVTPTTARQAAQQFLTNNAQRPTCLRWDPAEQ